MRVCSLAARAPLPPSSPLTVVSSFASVAPASGEKLAFSGVNVIEIGQSHLPAKSAKATADDASDKVSAAEPKADSKADAKADAKADKPSDKAAPAPAPVEESTAHAKEAAPKGDDSKVSDCLCHTFISLASHPSPRSLASKAAAPVGGPAVAAAPAGGKDDKAKDDKQKDAAKSSGDKGKDEKGKGGGGDKKPKKDAKPTRNVNPGLCADAARCAVLGDALLSQPVSALPLPSPPPDTHPCTHTVPHLLRSSPRSSLPFRRGSIGCASTRGESDQSKDQSSA